jgi:hypothetical protein
MYSSSRWQQWIDNTVIWPVMQSAAAAAAAAVAEAQACKLQLLKTNWALSTDCYQAWCNHSISMAAVWLLPDV